MKLYHSEELDLESSPSPQRPPNITSSYTDNQFSVITLRALLPGVFTAQNNPPRVPLPLNPANSHTHPLKNACCQFGSSTSASFK